MPVLGRHPKAGGWMGGGNAKLWEPSPRKLGAESLDLWLDRVSVLKLGVVVSNAMPEEP
jgi:hypothetical protein